MYNQTRNKRHSGGGDSWQKGFNKDKQMHRATCVECNASCQVPFRPNGRKPIYCSNCFEQTPDGAAKSKFKRENPKKDSFVRSDRSERSSGGSDVERRLRSIEKKLDQVLNALGVSVSRESRSHHRSKDNRSSRDDRGSSNRAGLNFE